MNDTLIIHFVDFFFTVLNLPTGQNRPLPYILTLIPPLILSLLDPEIFFKALDFAGTYGGIAKCSSFSLPF
jgi:tyrosine-specific transport protein